MSAAVGAGACVLACAMVALAPGAAAPAVPLSARIAEARANYARMEAQSPAAKTLLDGLNLEQRLSDDGDELQATPPPDFPAADWDETIRDAAEADVDLVAQLENKPAPFALEPGLHEHIVRSAVDGVLDAVGTYVPGEPANAVVVILHGNPQSEAELLGQPYLRRLADKSGTILIAPYGRGYYNFRGPATADFYGLLLMLQKMPELAGLHFYLAGYSMGGFTAYMIGPGAPAKWHGVLDISGALVGSATDGVMHHWAHTRIYIVHGDRDQSIPVRYAVDGASFLYDNQIPVSYYSVTAGSHSIRTLLPALGRAWADMLSGKVSDSEITMLARDREGADLPLQTPPAKMMLP